VLDAVLLGAVWLASLLLVDGGRPRLPPVLAALRTSYRVRLTATLAGFFVVPVMAFALWSFAQLRDDARQDGDLLIRQTLRAAGAGDSRRASAGRRRARPPAARGSDARPGPRHSGRSGRRGHARRRGGARPRQPGGRAAGCRGRAGPERAAARVSARGAARVPAGHVGVRAHGGGRAQEPGGAGGGAPPDGPGARERRDRRDRRGRGVARDDGQSPRGGPARDTARARQLAPPDGVVRVAPRMERGERVPRRRYGRRARGRAHRGARVRRGGATDPRADCVARAFA